MSEAVSADRVAALEQRLREENAQANDVLSMLPEEPTKRAAALATLMELDALQAIHNDVEIDDLVRERDARRRALDEARPTAAEQGVFLPGSEGEV